MSTPPLPETHDPQWLLEYRPSFACLFGEILRAKGAWIFGKRTRSPEIASVKYAHACGTPCWAGIVKARDLLWEAGPERFLWGMVVLAPKSPPTVAFRALNGILDRIHELTTSDRDLSPELSAFLQRVRDPMVSLSVYPVPEEVSPEVESILVDCFLDRQGLPGGVLKDMLLPTLFVNDTGGETPHACALNHQHWPARYREKWEAKSSVSASPSARAILVTNVPVNALDVLEEGVLEFCDQYNLSNLFLNVGSVVRDGSRPASGTEPSGDLAFLGLASELAEVLVHLQNLLASTLGADSLAAVRIQTLSEDEFGSRYGWLIDQIDGASQH